MFSKSGLKKLALWLLLSLGVLFIALIVLSFTDVPYFAYRKLSVENDTLSTEPNYIVVLGGSGMPSPDGLMRTYCAAAYAKAFQHAEIIIAHPSTSGDSLFQLKLMAKELVIRGVDSLRIQFEPNGHNTHTQAENIFELIGKQNLAKGILIVSSPEHLYRAVNCFRKVGFTAVGSAPAFDNPIEPSKLIGKAKSADEQIKNLNLRYNMWSYLNYELLTLREYFAIGYYKIMGWI